MGTNPPLREFLQQARAERGLSRPQFARLVGAPRSLAYKWEEDDPYEHANPSPESCRKIAAALNADLDYVLGLAGHRAAPLDVEPVEDDPIAREILAAIPEMRAAVEGIPREMWVTVLRATMRRATTDLRDTSNVISLASERKARRPVVSTTAGPVASTPGQVASTASRRKNPELKAYQLAKAS